MGLRDEFAEAREWVAKHLHFDRSTGISMFETVIRILGGLLSAFDLSGDRLFLDKSREVSERARGAARARRSVYAGSVFAGNACRAAARAWRSTCVAQRVRGAARARGGVR
eukprot:238795-Prymnesium_polylepis.1